MDKKKSGNLSVKKLIKYFSYAAEDVGKKDDEERAEGDRGQSVQAGYSLLWYFNNCMQDDCEPGSNSYSPLLAAYLGLKTSGILNPPAINSDERAFENQQLKKLFPKSSYELNSSQVEATHKALHYPISLIKGPPGTGKTETILRIAALAVAKGETVAVVSTNTAAVENVEQKLNEILKAYEDPLNKDLIERHKAEDLAFAAACKHASLGDISKRTKSKDPLTGKPFKFKAGRHEFANGKEISGWEQNHSFLEFTEKHKLITCTIHSLKKCFTDGDLEKYDLVIMDEASQTNLIVGIVALSCAKRIAIVGDEEQLPPVITDNHQKLMKKYASEKGLFKQVADSPYDISRDGLSFLSSCYQVFSNKNHELMTMLDEHFRCHKDIIGFCNMTIYDNKLTVKSNPCNSNVTCPIRICWYEGDYREGMWPPKAPSAENPNKKTRTTYVNRKQLSILEQEEAAHLVQLAEKKKSICILSPFRGQIHALQRSIRLVLKGTPAENAIEIEHSTDEEGSQLGAEETIRALTIHKSQGREYDVVYLLPVEDGNWEWPWSQGKRLVNVAASRAKEELIVVVSTKMMEEDTQKLLSRVTPVKKRAQLKDDVDEQEMYVRRLVEYVRTFRPIDKNESDYYGFHRSIISSVFDDIPWSQRPSKNNRWAYGHKGSRWAPEHCVAEALKRSLESLDGVGFLCDVKLNELCFQSGDLVSTACRDHYQNETEVHFDFMLFEKASGRVLIAIEVDGVQHRFSKKRGKPNDNQRIMDQIKNEVARDELNAELCWLGPIHPGSLEYEEEEPESVDGYKNHWPSWAVFPQKMSGQSSFVLLRIPSDGSTFWETDYLQQQAKDEGVFNKVRYAPPTIEEYVLKQRQINRSRGADDAIYVHSTRQSAFHNDGDLPTFPQKNADKGEPASSESGLNITACLKKWNSDPKQAAILGDTDAIQMNEALLRAGYHVLEDGNKRHRRPSERGREIGIEVFESEDDKGRYTVPCYSKKAQDYLAAHLQEILDDDDNRQG